MDTPPNGFIQRVVTRTGEDGLARFAGDAQVAFREAAGGDATFALLWSTDRFPADNSDERDGAARPVGLAAKNGSVLRIVDMKPGSRSPMHRTLSIDYGIVLEGEIVLELDSGEERIVRQGGVVIQRGTNHAWANRTRHWVRMAFVLLDAHPVQAGGHALTALNAEH